MSSLWSLILGKSPPPDLETERWRSTLRAAATAPFYARWKKEIQRAQAAATDEARREALLRLPEVELEYFFQHFRQFRAQESAIKPLRARTLAAGVRAIWPGATRTAVVSPWFHAGGDAKLLVKPSFEELRKINPEVVAAPAAVLDDLAQPDEWSRNTTLFAVVALAGVGVPLPGLGARERLWRAFGVPLYVQLRGFQGELLARECEAHNGLHFDPSDVVAERRPSGELLLTSLANPRHTVLRLASRLEAWLDMRTCECGLATPRLMDLRAATGAAHQYAPPPAPSLEALASAVGPAQRLPAPHRLSRR